MILHALLGATPGCVLIEGLPEDVRGHKHAQLEVRAAMRNRSWALVGTDGEELINPARVRSHLRGIVFVGDSQVREVAWAALTMLLGSSRIRFNASSKSGLWYPRPDDHEYLRPPSPCLPTTFGRWGFTATCGRVRSAPCRVLSPFANRTEAEAAQDAAHARRSRGRVLMHRSVCDPEVEFFVAFHATMGATPINPGSLPTCLLPNETAGDKRPVLWVLNGGGMHELVSCHPNRWSLPQVTFSRFTQPLLRSGLVIWQPIGGSAHAHLSNATARPCITPKAGAELGLHATAELGLAEATWLRHHGVQHYAYTQLAARLAPLMSDGMHFTYYWEPCAHTFPEIPRLLAQLVFQLALGRPVELCPSLGGPGPPAVLTRSSLAGRGTDRPAGEPGGHYVNLGQSRQQAEIAFRNALRLSAKLRS